VGTHDLRRTLATGLGNLGIPDEIIERVLNHAPRTIAGKHYNHGKHFEPMRRALEAWGERIEVIIEGREPASNVVPLRSAGSAE
jgi:integrase